MRKWNVLSEQRNIVIVTNFVAAGVVSFLLLCGPNAEAAQEVGPLAAKPNILQITDDHSVVIDAEVERSCQFQKLISRWHEQREGMSWITEMAMCPAYQSIIGMGPTVIPLILSQLESEGDEPDHWFWALQAITEVNPVTDADRGNIVKMAEAWLRWGTQQGYAG
jgi:hypothetical protein